MSSGNQIQEGRGDSLPALYSEFFGIFVLLYFDKLPGKKMVSVQNPIEPASLYDGDVCYSSVGFKTIGARSVSDSQHRYPSQPTETPPTQTQINFRKCGTEFIFL